LPPIFKEDSPQSSLAFRHTLENIYEVLLELPEIGTTRNFHNPEMARGIFRHVSMQLGDVREMLRLPLPTLNMTHACNFAAAGTLCGFISGISISIYQPVKTTEMKKYKGIMQKVWVRPGYAFKQLLKDFYLGAPARTAATASPLPYTTISETPWRMPWAYTTTSLPGSRSVASRLSISMV
jgi:hypothetical protein